MKTGILQAILFIAILSISTPAQTATGGAFTLEKSVIANGGGQSAGGAFIVEGTSGQSVAGTRSVDSAKILHGGFWQAAPFAPTAARVSLGGRVLTSGGQGIRSVSVTLTLSDGSLRTARTGSFGYYHFTEIEAGQIVTLSVAARRYSFASSSIVLNVIENAGELDFIADDF